MYGNYYSMAIVLDHWSTANSWTGNFGLGWRTLCHTSILHLADHQRVYTATRSATYQSHINIKYNLHNNWAI